MLALLLSCCMTPYAATGHDAATGHATTDDVTDGQTDSRETPDPTRAAEATIAEWLRTRVGHEAKEVNIQLEGTPTRLANCDNATPFLPREDTPPWGRITVAVACDTPPTPRYIQVRVIALGSYITAATTIQPGTVIEPWMLTTSQGDLGTLPSRALLDPVEALGLEARQRLPEGGSIQAHQLRAPTLVTRGETVVIEVQGRGFSINREGEALDSGGRGEPVRVKVSHQQTLTATVLAAGRVSVSR